jgi:glucosylceramidase
MNIKAIGKWVLALSLLSACSQKSIDNKLVKQNDSILAYYTSANQSKLLYKQSIVFNSVSTTNYSTISIDPSVKYQTIDGFGYTLTGASALLINNMNTSDKMGMLNNLFALNNDQSIGVNYLRVSLGASDLSTEVFSYDDLLPGEIDTLLNKFSLSKDTVNLIPVLKQIIAINPKIKILASPWSAPAWMKSNTSSIGGNLLPRYYDAYAKYFVKYISAMKAYGINIDAITIQNEPNNGGNNPSMLMSAQEQINFIKNYLGPSFASEGIRSKIIIWDHNCDNTTYPITVLNDSKAASFIDGSAFHLYSGDISALSQVKAAYPEKKLYFTEQWTGADGSFSSDFMWHMKNVVIGSLKNWSSVVLEWNLANDPFYNLHTPGGCTQCKGALTISNATYQKNVSYYIIAQIAKFIPSGSVRINSSEIADLDNVAFLTPDGKIVLLVLNSTNTDKTFSVLVNNTSFNSSISSGTAVTYIWQTNS